MRLVSVLLGTALVAVSGYALHLSREVSVVRQQLAEIAARLAQSQAGSSERIGAQLVSVEEPSRAPAIREAPRSQPSAPTRAAVADVLATVRERMSAPEGIARSRENARHTLRMTNPDIEEAVGLSPEELDGLLDLLSVQQLRSSAVFEDARKLGDQAAGRRLIADGLEENRRLSEGELQAFLGAKYPRWQDYQQTRPAWSKRRDLRAVLQAAGTPLSPQQDRALMAGMLVEQRHFVQSRPPGTVPSQQSIADLHQRLLSLAAGHLSAQQLEGYRQMLERSARQNAEFAALTAAASTAGAQ